MNHVAVVTGASGGIGTALTQTFREQGWYVIGIDRELHPGCDEFYSIDLADSAAIAAFAAEFLRRHARLGALVNNAALQRERTLIETTDAEWDAVFAVNVGAAFRLTRDLFPALAAARGAVVNISSVHARATSPGMAAYVASKGAVSALTRAMALELAPHGIRANAVLPGAIETPMLARGLERSGDGARARATLVNATPLGRIAEPREIAELALFLADGTRAAYITGQEFVCDGGVLARLASE